MTTMAVLDWIWVIICPILAYFIGSIPFSFILAKKTSGIDLTKTGNKNVGGLNTMITSGFGIGFLAGFLDYSKGLVCAVLALVLPFSNEIAFGRGTYFELTWHRMIYILVSMFVVLGHNYSIYIKFQGGRGIAAIVSFLVLLNPLMLSVFIIGMVIFAFITKTLRPSQLIALFIGAPVAFLWDVIFGSLNFYPPWIIQYGMASAFTMGLYIVGLGIIIFPKYIGPFINMFKGKEYKLSKSGEIENLETEKT
jgi:glycerol-3-phosphate acyltransferase PlsY